MRELSGQENESMDVNKQLFSLKTSNSNVVSQVGCNGIVQKNVSCLWVSQQNFDPSAGWFPMVKLFSIQILFFCHCSRIKPDKRNTQTGDVWAEERTFESERSQPQVNQTQLIALHWNIVYKTLQNSCSISFPLQIKTLQTTAKDIEGSFNTAKQRIKQIKAMLCDKRQ